VAQSSITTLALGVGPKALLTAWVVNRHAGLWQCFRLFFFLIYNPENEV
jgi:hypothetical protein